MTVTAEFKIEPKIGEGIYTKRDVSEILNLPYQKVSRWMEDFWGDYTFGIEGNKCVNFKTLIEFFTFYHLRNNGVSSQEIKKIHTTISTELNTPYPFAQKIHINKGDQKKNCKDVYYENLDNLIRTDGKKQYDIKELLISFLDKIEFNNDAVASRLFPLENSKRLVIDPKFQFGQPTITGTGIKAEVINGFIQGGESKEFICKIYNLNIEQVNDAILYYKRSA